MLVTAARLLMGIIYLVNGLNWWFKIITPYPSMSDFTNFLPPPDIVGAMIENGIMFNMVKAIELLTGLALLTNRFVPLALIVAFPVTFPIFLVDVFTNTHLRGVTVGTASLLLNIFLLAAYMRHYQGLLTANGEAAINPAQSLAEDAPYLARLVAKVARPIMPVLGVLAATLGVVTVGWLVLMIGEYVVDPRPLSAVHQLTPR